MGTVVHDLQDCENSIKNGTYGGMAGYKEGVLYCGIPWLVKYPKNISHIKDEEGVYASSPVSEYIGSHIFQMLGIPTHETILGYRNGKLVVACKDFLQKDDTLLEIRTLKNLVNKDFEKAFDRQFGPTGSTHVVDWEELHLHLKHNPVLSNGNGVMSRFIKQAVVDILINNNDRNNGNWGLIRRPCEDGWKDFLAPVYDNGASFSPNLTDEEVYKRLSDKSLWESSACNTQVAYGANGKNYTSKQFCQILPTLEGAYDIIWEIAEDIRIKLPAIAEFIAGIPEHVIIKGEPVRVMSTFRKALYIAQLDVRYDKLIRGELLEANARVNRTKHSNDLCDIADDI